MIPAHSRFFVVPYIVLFLTVVPFLRAEEEIFSDDFSESQLRTGNLATGKIGWKVEKGLLGQDGGPEVGNYKPVEGQLNFGREPGTSVSIQLPKDKAKLFYGLSFLLRQSNGASGGNYVFTVRLEDSSVDGGYYMLKLTLNPAYFTGTGYAGFAYKSLEKKGPPGEAIQLGTSAFQKVEITFDSVQGVDLLVEGVHILTIPNKFDLDKIDRITLINESGTVSWFIDNLAIGSRPR